METNAQGLAIINAYSEEYWTTDVSNAEAIVRITVREPLTPNQFSACVSLAVNIGADQFRRSKIPKLLNSRRMLEAANEFMEFVELDGKPHRPFVKRRKEEKALFLTPSLVAVRVE